MLAAAGTAALLLGGAPGVAVAGVATGPGPVPVATVTPGAGAVVGVGAPVTVRFATAVTDRAAAENSIEFSSPSTPDGTFAWRGADLLEWTPTGLWPAHSTIFVTAGDFKTSFETGSAVVGVADIDAHTFTVSVDGQVVREMPASMGKPKFSTPVGQFTALEKQDVVVMDSRTIGIPLSDPEGYKLTVYDAVRVTWGGVYVHGAPWSTGSQGYANVSHGCINLSPDNAAWYYDMVSIGDPIIVQS